ncbi:MAG: nucleotidyl transferase AbiEii/AbiGii toxin family protein [Thermoanaerobaculia bacterium]
MARRRQLLVFDRFLARIVAVLGDAAMLKGGLALEHRLERARTTKDVDLRMMGSPYNILAQLQEAGRRELGDFMIFEVGPDEGNPEIQNDGMQYNGLRFRAEGKLAGKLYGQRFGVDVAFGDPILGDPEVVVAEDVLSFAGIAPPILRLYPIETHIAEKLHAYTMPRTRPSSRVKDLPDIALLARPMGQGPRPGGEEFRPLGWCPGL